jgi:N-formylmethionyl-tRNA deformylase
MDYSEIIISNPGSVKQSNNCNFAENFKKQKVMVLPIVAYGHPVLRKLAQDIDADFPLLDKLIADMWETMYASNGVGLAAPQVNKDIRLFIVDSQQIFNNLEPDEKNKFPDEPGIKQVFINASC